MYLKDLQRQRGKERSLIGLVTPQMFATVGLAMSKPGDKSFIQVSHMGVKSQELGSAFPSILARS